MDGDARLEADGTASRGARDHAGEPRTSNGAEAQAWSAEGYARNARFVADLRADALALLAPRADVRILDLGCGDGALTRRIADEGVAVVGADSSPDLVAAARLLGIEAHVTDGGALPFAAEFDAVFSNAALHWILRPRAVIAGVRRALRPAGRFVGGVRGPGQRRGDPHGAGGNA